MILFGTISLPALNETLTPIIQRALHGRLISAAPKLLLNLALSYRGFRSLRLAAQ
jgi:hypothetical protein